MIELERLNGETFLLNAFMIEQIQSHPDTTITLFNGKKMVVQTPEADVLEKMTDYYRRIGIIGSMDRSGEQL